MTELEQVEKEHTFRAVRYIHEIAVSIYFSLLVIMSNAVSSILHPTGNSWTGSLYSLFAGGRLARSYEDTTLRLAFFCLWAVAAGLVFLCLRGIARFSIAQFVLGPLAGVIALIGFPLTLWYVTFRSDLRAFGFPRALLYASYYHAPHWFLPELATTLACAYLYYARKWPTKALWALPILVLHFAVWTSLVMMGAGSGHILLWPGYGWTRLTRDFPSLIYPFLGLLASLIWGKYVRLERTPGARQRR